MKPWMLAAALVCSATVHAHDTWFEPLSRNARGELAMALGTGDKFPVHDVAIGPDLMQSHGCRAPSANSKTTRLRLLRSEDRSASYRVATGATAGEPVTCWMQMHPIELQVADATADLYLKEIGAGPALRTQWNAMRARGVGWHERYVKSARIEWAGGAGPNSSGSLSRTEPVGTAMDVLMNAPRQNVLVGDSVTFQVLRDGVPLPDLPVEFVNDVSPIGLWRRTDAQGQVIMALPLAARWMLRGTDLRLSTANPDFWESRFVTLTFEVSARQ